MTTDEIVDKIMKIEKDLASLKDIDLSKFSKSYLDLLELRELEYNISNYAS
jgi:hypothetical protein